MRVRYFEGGVNELKRTFLHENMVNKLEPFDQLTENQKVRLEKWTSEFHAASPPSCRVVYQPIGKAYRLTGQTTSDVSDHITLYFAPEDAGGSLVAMGRKIRAKPITLDSLASFVERQPVKPIAKGANHHFWFSDLERYEAAQATKLGQLPCAPRSATIVKHEANVEFSNISRDACGVLMGAHVVDGVFSVFLADSDHFAEAWAARERQLNDVQKSTKIEF